MVIARRNLMGGKPLPYDAEVEYLESTGTQWIDTGILPTLETSVFLDFTTTTTTNTMFIFGARTRAAYGPESWTLLFRQTASGSAIRCDWTGGSADVLPNSQPSPGRRFLVYADMKEVTLGDDSLPVNGKVVVPYPFYLFTCNTAGVPQVQILTAQFASCWIKHGEMLVLDFIPVRFTNENGVSEGAMYDRVSGQLFRNAGTGAFVIGPDKASGAFSTEGGGY